MVVQLIVVYMCVLAVMWLSVFCVSPSWCRGQVGGRGFSRPDLILIRKYKALTYEYASIKIHRGHQLKEIRNIIINKPTTVPESR